MEEFILLYDPDNQGSLLWKKRTCNSTGGSSIYDLKRDPASFLMKRLVGDRTFSNIAMDFGSIFEDVIRVYLSKLINEKIHVLGAVPFIVNDEGQYLCHYSMDGMFKANIHHIKGVGGEDLFPDEVKTYLLEIKTPWSRELKVYKRTCASGKKGECNIPMAYRDQVKMGLVIIHPCEIGIFVDCFARVCRLGDLCEERKFEMSPVHQEPRNTITQVLASGVIKVYVKDILQTPFAREIKDVKSLYKTCPKTVWTEDLVNQYMSQFFDFELRPCRDPIDFGKNPKDVLKYIREDAEEANQMSLSYIVNMGLSEVIIDNDEPGLLGYIPWKIFDIYYGRIEKEEDFLNNHIETIKCISNVLYKCQDMSVDEKLKYIDGFEIL